eukprot:m51a1_g8286 3',5'-cyclic-AMP phosphodiesterase, putative (1887) ;mRNA; f:114079-122154
MSESSALGVAAVPGGASNPVFAMSSAGILQFIEYVHENSAAIKGSYTGLVTRTRSQAQAEEEASFAAQGFAFRSMVGRDEALRKLLGCYSKRFHDVRAFALPAGRDPNIAQCRLANKAYMTAAAPGTGKTRFVHELGRLRGARLAGLLDMKESDQTFLDPRGFAQSVARWQAIHVTYSSTTEKLDVEVAENQESALAARVLYSYVCVPMRNGALKDFLLLAARLFGSPPALIPNLQLKDVLQAVFEHSGRSSVLLTIDETRSAPKPPELVRLVVATQDGFTLPGVRMLYTFITSLNVCDPMGFSRDCARESVPIALEGLVTETAEQLFFDEFPDLKGTGLYHCAVADAGGHPRTLSGVRTAAEYYRKHKGQTATYENIANAVKEALLSTGRTEGLSVALIRAAFLAQEHELSGVIEEAGPVEALVANGKLDNTVGHTGMERLIPRISQLRMWVWANSVIKRTCPMSDGEETEEVVVAKAICDMLCESAWRDPVAGHPWESFVMQHHVLMNRFLCSSKCTAWVPLRTYLRGALLGGKLASLEIELRKDTRFVDRTTEFYVPGVTKLDFRGLFLANVREAGGSDIHQTVFAYECKNTLRKINSMGKDEKPSMTNLASSRPASSAWSGYALSVQDSALVVRAELGNGVLWGLTVSMWLRQVVAGRDSLYYTLVNTDNTTACRVYSYSSDVYVEVANQRVSAPSAIPAAESAWVHALTTWRSSDGLLCHYEDGLLVACGNVSMARGLALAPGVALDLAGEVWGVHYWGLYDEVLVLDDFLSADGVARLRSGTLSAAWRASHTLLHLDFDSAADAYGSANATLAVFPAGAASLKVPSTCPWALAPTTSVVPVARSETVQLTTGLSGAVVRSLPAGAVLYQMTSAGSAGSLLHVGDALSNAQGGLVVSVPAAQCARESFVLEAGGELRTVVLFCNRAPTPPTKAIELSPFSACTTWDLLFDTHAMLPCDADADRLTLSIASLPTRGILQYENGTAVRVGDSCGRTLTFCSRVLNCSNATDSFLFRAWDGIAYSAPVLAILDQTRMCTERKVIEITTLEDTPVLVDLGIESDQFMYASSAPTRGTLYGALPDGSIGDLFQRDPEVQMLHQWVSAITNVSSYWHSTDGSWGYDQMLGPPDVCPEAGDRAGAWAPEFANNHEWIIFKVAVPVYLHQIGVYENWHAGDVVGVSALTPHGWKTLYSGPVDASIFDTKKCQIVRPPLVIESEEYKVDTFRLDIAPLGPSIYSEIDAIEVVGFDSLGYVSRLYYSPDKDLSGSDAFDITFRVDDTEGGGIGVIQAKITVVPVPDPPTLPESQVFTVDAMESACVALAMPVVNIENESVFLEVLSAPAVGKIGGEYAEGSGGVLVIQGTAVTYCPPEFTSATSTSFAVRAGLATSRVFSAASTVTVVLRNADKKLSKLVTGITVPVSVLVVAALAGAAVAVAVHLRRQSNRITTLELEKKALEDEHKKLDTLLNTPADRVFNILTTLQKKTTLTEDDHTDLKFVATTIAANRLFKVDSAVKDMLQERVDSDIRDYLYDQLLDNSTEATGKHSMNSIRSIHAMMQRAHFEEADLSDPNFDAFDLTNKLGSPLKIIGYQLFDHYRLFEVFEIDPAVFQLWICEVEAGYNKENPYHNATHATDVTQMVNCLLSENSANFSDLEILAILFAAIVHDFRHPGKNNNYLMVSRDPLAITYNNISVLENYHVSQAFELLLKKELNFLSKLSPQDFKAFHQLVVQLVLSTDISRHLEILAAYKAKASAMGGKLDWKQADFRLLHLQMLIKMADVCNGTRPWDVCRKWALSVCNEFWSQGDAERTSGMAVSPFMDRDSPSIPRMQLAFFDFVVRPIVEVLKPHIFVCTALEANLESNLSTWRSLPADYTGDDAAVNRPT